MSYESAENPSTTRVLPGTLAQYKVTDRERLGDYEAVTGANGYGDYLTTNLTMGNPFRRHGYDPLTAHMAGYGEPPADDCPVGAARDPIFNLCLPTGGANNPNCPPGLTFDTAKGICVWPQDLPPNPPPPPLTCPSGYVLVNGLCVAKPIPSPPPPPPPPPPQKCQIGFTMTLQGCQRIGGPIVQPVQPEQANMITAGIIAAGAIALVGIGFYLIHGKT